MLPDYKEPSPTSLPPNTTGLTDFGTNYLSIKVTYNPNTDQWELFVRNDGASAFADPTTGTLVSQGTAVNTTYVGTALTLMGGILARRYCCFADGIF
jgi:hypothetical protein